MDNSMIKTRFVALDGKSNGFAAYVYATEKFVTGKNGEMKLFKNINLLKSWIENKNEIHNPYDFKLFVVIEGKQIDFNDIQKIFEYYEYYDEENDLHYFIAEDNTEKVLSIGYLVFGDGNIAHKDTNPKDGRKQNNMLMNISKRTAGLLMRKPSNKIESIKWVNCFKTNKGTTIGSHYVINLKGSTGKIHVMKNSELIEFNMIRKDIGERCLPFEKSMDKFKSLYVYITKDNGDIKNVDDDIIKVLDSIVYAIQYLEPDLDCRYIPVEFQGVIFIGGLEHESNKDRS